MVFHIAGVELSVNGFSFAFELAKEVAGRFAQDVDQNIEATSMRHADDDLFYTNGATLLNELLHCRN